MGSRQIDQLPKVVREGKIATEQPGVTRGDAKTAMAEGGEAVLRNVLLPVPGTCLDGTVVRSRRLADRMA